MRKVLLICGILSPLLYAAANVVAPMQFEGYDWVSQTVSELSAIDSPTRRLWLVFMVPYSLLTMAFAMGIWMSAGKSRALRLAAVCGFVHVTLGLFWPPMHLRGAEFTLTDTLHILWTAFTVPIMLLQIIFAAAAYGRGFRIYSALTILTMIVFGILTGIDAPNIAANGPTPFIGIWERVGIAAQMLWVAVFAVKLLRELTTRPVEYLPVQTS